MTNRQDGFTLVELLVTLSVAAIMLAIAVPAFTYTVNTNQLSGETNAFIGALNTARASAVSRNQPVYACAATYDSALNPSCATGSSDWSKGVLVFADGASSTVGTFGANSAKIKSVQFKGATITLGSAVSGANVDSKAITFGSDGRVIDGISRRLLVKQSSSGYCSSVILNGSGRTAFECSKTASGTSTTCAPCN